MKRFFAFVALMGAMLLASCSEFDDSKIWDKLEDHENRIAKLEELCKQMNTNISSLQTIVNALQNNDYVTSVTPVTKDGETIGYTITFTKSQPITIYHGEDGKDGADGKDGSTPVIGVKQDIDGIYYWTLNDEWLLDTNGNKIKAQGTDGNNGENGTDGEDGKDGANGANGKDGITPQLKIENDYWYISYDNGASWTQLGKATGEDGKDGENGTNGEDGDSFFQSVTQDEDYVYLTLSTGEQIDVPKHHPLSVTFTETEDIRVLADKTYTIGYTITGADDKTVIKALAQDGFRAVIKKSDNATGVIEITTPSTILPTEILVFVTDGKERTIMRSINFVEGVIIVSSKSYTVDYAGGTVQVPLSTNIDYTVEIPEADKSWISVAETRAVMRDETLTFTVAENEAQSVRYTTVKLVDDLGVVSETILITQKAGIAKSLNVATAGTLENLIGSDEKNLVEELTLTGKLNTFDFDFIKTMSNLKLLDISATTNTTLPASCLANTKITTVLLPLGLTAIPNRAFYQATITSIYIPETVQTIGEYAFYQCKSIKGNLVIPDATTLIGNYCFQECTFDGTLTFGSGLKTIGEYAFSQCAEFTGDLIIPDCVTTLGQYAFNECSGFTGKLVIGEGVTAINNFTFFKCSNLSGGVSISTNATIIGEGAFAYCSKLTGNLTIPDKVTTIDYAAFYGCNNFKGYLKLGESVSEIKSFAFMQDEGYHISNLAIVLIPINFSRIYCLARTVPKTVLSGGSFSSIDAAYGLDPWTDVDKDIRNRYSAFLFEQDIESGNLLPGLVVPVGMSSIYKSSNTWGRMFAVIEEAEF